MSTNHGEMNNVTLPRLRRIEIGCERIAQMLLHSVIMLKRTTVELLHLFGYSVLDK